MRTEVADELEAFVRDGLLWDEQGCLALVARLTAESDASGDPLPARIGRFLQSVVIRRRIADVAPELAVEIEAIVYPRLWKVIEAVRDGMPQGELRTRIEVMNRRLARLFVEETF